VWCLKVFVELGGQSKEDDAMDCNHKTFQPECEVFTKEEDL
jgi:hypothetical protein